MAQGYSIRLAKRIEKAWKKDKDNKALVLAMLCVKHEVPVQEVAEYLSTSRENVYNWFAGEYRPSDVMMPKVEELINRLVKHYEPAQTK